MRLLFNPSQNLTNVHSDEWLTYKLACQKSLRIAAIHAIADRQYNRQQSAFISAGLFDRDEDMWQAEPVLQPNKTILLNFITHIKVPANFNPIADACWQILSGEISPNIPLSAAQVNIFRLLDHFGNIT